jgi:hypothetical protein
VLPFTQRADGEDVIIANAAQSAFLAVPPAAVEILSGLAAGMSVGEVARRYEARHGEHPDVDDLLDVLQREGFVAAAAPAAVAPAPAGAAGGRAPRWARWIASLPVLVVCGALVGAALALIVADPGLLPSPEVLVFRTQALPMVVATLGLLLGSTLLHELAHLVTARAAGARCRLTLGRRMWVLVAETDMSAMWLASRRQRQAALLAGPLFDATLAAGLVCLLAAARAGWLPAPPGVLLLGRVWLLVSLIQLLWQCYFFVRTDFYYVVATAFNCRNLMGDTEALLRNQLARVFPSRRTVDQAHIPARERRVIRAYAVVWVAGRLLALASLLLITLPVLVAYCQIVAATLLGGDGGTAGAGDLTWIVFAVGLQGAGLVLWARGLTRARKETS